MILLAFKTTIMSSTPVVDETIVIKNNSLMASRENLIQESLGKSLYFQ